MPKQITISPKDLGAMSLEDFCPRCFWIKRNAKLPWQIFPGIFSSIDSYTKKVVHAYIDAHGCGPEWMPASHEICGWEKAPHWSKFQWTDPVTGITMRGVVDDILILIDKSIIIPDYKTAAFTANADKLLPMYRVQLNSYAIIAESMGREVHAIPLIYCQPVTDEEVVEFESVWEPDGFSMGFSPKVLPVERSSESVLSLLVKAREIIDGKIPEQNTGCQDCEKLAAIVSTIS